MQKPDGGTMVGLSLSKSAWCSSDHAQPILPAGGTTIPDLDKILGGSGVPPQSCFSILDTLSQGHKQLQSP